MKKNKFILISLVLIFIIIEQVLSKLGSETINQLINIYIIAIIIIMIFRGLLWLVVLKQINLSLAYPYISFSFVAILIISYFWFGESLTIYKIIGCLLIIIGIIFCSFGQNTKEA